MKKLVGSIVALGIVLGAGLAPGLYAKQNAQTFDNALTEARAIDRVIRATRSNYTKMVVAKLKAEGTGASLDAEETAGYVPLPAVFVRRIAFDMVRQRRVQGDTQFSVALRSTWNLNENQGLLDDFERDGWQNLLEQQQAHLAAGRPLKELQWQPYVKLTQGTAGKQLLRYLSADTASQQGCVSCHNSWEQNEEVMARRTKGGIVKPGKVFKKHELMGALSIAIQVE